MSANEPTAATFKRHFFGTESTEDREVDASLIRQAAETGLRIDVRRAIIKGALELRSNTAEAEICLAGCDFTDRVRFSYCTFKASVDLSGSIFRKECCFRAATIAGEFRLIGATFCGSIVRFDDVRVHGVVWADRVRFDSRTRFRRAKFEKSVFFRHGKFHGQANFEETQFSGEAAFTGAVFEQKANFSSVQILGQAGFIGVIFKKDVSFNAARIESHALFRRGPGSAAVTRFDGAADFTACQINLSADFRGARFKGTANFNSVYVGGDTYFWSEAGATPIITIFEQDADFTGAHFGGDADFSGVIFASAFLEESPIARTEADRTPLTSEQKQIPYISFNGATFDRHARFSSKTDEGHEALITTFGLDADFTSARIGGLALFEGVRFERNAYFNFVHITSNARFSLSSEKPPLRTIFRGHANFTGTKVCGNATFQGAWFLDKATFKGMDIGGIANFECDKFERLTAFDHAHFSQDVHFEGAIFRPDFSFREASFRVVSFSPDGKVGGDNQFQGPLDLTGLTYDRIQVDWQGLLIKADGKSRITFDLQSYNQLEKTFRLIGKDREADRIYLERCRVERREKWNRGKGVRKVGWVGSALYGAIANYGVRPVRLAIYSFVLVVVGAIVFSQPGAVKPSKEETSETHQQSALFPANTSEAPQPAKLSLLGGLAVSVHQFLPVDIPSGTGWKPSGKRFIYVIPSHAYASLLKIAGWIFVPLGVAAVTGVLRRVR